jgi:hypothetical protein
VKFIRGTVQFFFNQKWIGVEFEISSNDILYFAFGRRPPLSTHWHCTRAIVGLRQSWFKVDADL